MKTGGLFVLSFLLALCLVPSPASAQWCQDINGPYWCGDPDACQGICNEPGSDCTTPCKRLGGTWTVCGGGSATDADGDGVGDGTDNCLCIDNLNQADCDEDGTGDVCDSRNEKWVFVQDLGYCDWDGDVHFGYVTVERYAADRYQNVCNGSYCSDKRFLDDESCHGPFSTDECCHIEYGSTTCNINNQCGSPNCPF